MKKRIIAISFIIIFISAIVWLIIAGTKPEVLPIGSRLPKINIEIMDGTEMINNDKKTLIVFFSKECSHCKYELEILNSNIDKLKETQIYLLTADKNYLKMDEIIEYKNLLNATNVKFGIVNKEDYKNNFGGMVTPTLYFFNKEGKLTAKLKGETKLERILQELNI